MASKSDYRAILVVALVAIIGTAALFSLVRGGLTGAVVSGTILQSPFSSGQVYQGSCIFTCDAGILSFDLQAECGVCDTKLLKQRCTDEFDLPADCVVVKVYCEEQSSYNC